MMPGRVIPGMAASRSIPRRRLCQIQGVPASRELASLLVGSDLKRGDLVGADLMHSTAEFLDARAKPS